MDPVAGEEIIELHVGNNIPPTPRLDEVKISGVFPSSFVHNPGAAGYDTAPVCNEKIVEVL